METKKKCRTKKDHFLKQQNQNKMLDIIFSSFPGFTAKRKKKKEYQIQLHADCTTTAAMETHHKRNLAVWLSVFTYCVDIAMNLFIVLSETAFCLQK